MSAWVFAGFLGLGLLASLALTPLAASLARRLGILDHPGARKIHHHPKPLLGGVAVLLSFYGITFGALAAGLLLLRTPSASLIPDQFLPYLHNISANSGQVLWRFCVIGIGGFAVFLLGLVDDLKGLGAGLRLCLQFGIAAFVVLAGVQPELGFLPRPFAQFVAMTWIVGIMNAFNFIDGLDGEAAGVGAIAGGILAVAMARWSQPLVAVLLCTLSGSLLGFLRYNFFPSSIFLGSCGSLLLGYLLGVIVLVSTFIVDAQHGTLPIAMPVLVMGIPLYDIASVCVIRAIRGVSLFQGDRSHLGHRLMRRGFTQKQAVLCIYVLTFSVALNALLLPTLSTLDSLLVLVQVLSILGVVILLERIRIRPDSDES